MQVTKKNNKNRKQKEQNLYKRFRQTLKVYIFILPPVEKQYYNLYININKHS